MSGTFEPFEDLTEDLEAEISGAPAQAAVDAARAAGLEQELIRAEFALNEEKVKVQRLERALTTQIERYRAERQSRIYAEQERDAAINRLEKCASYAARKSLEQEDQQRGQGVAAN